MTSTVPATIRCHDRIIQNWQDLLRAHPGVYINLLALNPSRGLAHFFIATAAGTEFAISVRGNLGTDRGSAQVRDVAEKFHRAFAVAVLEFAIGRAHPAERLDTASHALGHSRAFGLPQSQEGFLPNFLHSGLAHAERFLLRNHANPNFSV